MTCLTISLLSHYNCSATPPLEDSIYRTFQVTALIIRSHFRVMICSLESYAQQIFLKASVPLNCSPSVSRLGNSNYHQLLPSGSAPRYFLFQGPLQEYFLHYQLLSFHFISDTQSSLQTIPYTHYTEAEATPQQKHPTSFAEPFPSPKTFFLQTSWHD